MIQTLPKQLLCNNDSTELQIQFLDFLKIYPLARDVFSQELFKEIHPILDLPSVLLEFQIDLTHDEIYKFYKSFNFQNKSGHSVSSCYSFYLYKKPDELLPRLVMIHLLYNRENLEVVGYSVQTLYRDQSGHLASKLDFLKRLPTAIEAVGIADDLMNYHHQMLQRLNVRRMSLDCGWLGRQVWAQKGYKFDPKINILYNGIPLTQSEAARRNFSHFLKKNNLNLKDMVLYSSAGRKKRIKTIEDLQQPIDYIHLVHRKGKKLSIRPCIDHESYGNPQNLDIGKAFALGHYYPAHSRQQNTVVHPEYPHLQFADDALIVWSTYRDLEAKTLPTSS